MEAGELHEHHSTYHIGCSYHQCIFQLEDFIEVIQQLYSYLGFSKFNIFKPINTWKLVNYMNITLHITLDVLIINTFFSWNTIEVKQQLYSYLRFSNFKIFKPINIWKLDNTMNLLLHIILDVLIINTFFSWKT